MTEEPRDPIAEWHKQFAPATAEAIPGQARPELADQVAVEHFADADGVFTASAPTLAEPDAGPNPKKDRK